jgi:hypothetical protein
MLGSRRHPRRHEIAYPIGPHEQMSVFSGARIVRLTGVGDSAMVNDVAIWLSEEVVRVGELRQDAAADEVMARFERGFVYQGSLGLCVDPRVLRRFRALSDATVVWEHRGKRWRRRAPSDSPGRQQI